jgi:general secretion pathway protein L
MPIISDGRALLDDWIAAVAAALQSVLGRLVRRHEVVVIERPDGSFAVNAAMGGKGAVLPETAFRIVDGVPSPSFSGEWLAAFRASRVELRLHPDQVLVQPLEFPRQAVEFLDGMIRAQIDRLTPWSAHEVAFGWSDPETAGGDRVHLMLAATSKRAIEPLIALGRHVGAQSVVGVVEQNSDAEQPRWIKVFDVSIQGMAGLTFSMPRVLGLGLLGAGALAAASLAIAAYLGDSLDLERQQLQHQIAERRAALRLSQNGAAGSPQALLVKRKQSTPAAVMVLESISKVLPDGTYVTELRVEADKVQIVGMTQDAPPLIRLIEQSPQFTRATFFAPTTRTQNEPGERFHIEAHIKPYFGPAS